MLKIGLTGGIGSGKTTVAKIFETLGIPVFDADKAAKELMNNNEELKNKLIDEFGDLVYKNNLVDNKYLASIIFNDSCKLATLNSLVHPITIKAGVEWVATQNAPYVIKEAALLFEAGNTVGLDFVIGVFAPKYLRIKRLLNRDKTTINAIEARMNNQINDNLKMKLCDYVIINNEGKLVLPQIIELHNKLVFIAQQ